MMKKYSLLLLLLIASCGGGGGSGEPQAQSASNLTVVSTSPAAGATGVAIDSTITVTFSEALDVSTVNNSTFTVSGVTGSVTCCGDDGKTATFTPFFNLSYGTTYTGSVTMGVNSTALTSRSLEQNYTWTFTIVPMPDLLGNYRFVYFAFGETLENRFTVNTNSGATTQDGQEIFVGYSLVSQREFILSWSPTLGQFVGIIRTSNNLSLAYYFNIEDNDQLTGCFHVLNMESGGITACFSLKPESRKYPLGSWERSALERVGTGTSETLAERMERLASETELDQGVDPNLAAKIKELVSVLERHQGGN